MSPSSLISTALFIPLTVGFLLALGIVPICRWVALRAGFVAHPQEERWHQKRTALLGGTALVVTTVLLTLGYAENPPVVLLCCASTIFVLGFIDDVWNIPAAAKLVCEIVLASALLYFGYRLEWTGSLTLDSLLTIIWVVGITNAFNLLDNMDGLCAGIGLIAGVTLLLGWTSGNGIGGEVVYLAVLLGSLAAFLVYNVHPASIFMGDSGSLFIGFSLSVLALASTGVAEGSRGVLAAIAAPVSVLVLPILDTTLVTASRLLSGRSAAQGGRDHSSHRLVAMGLSQRAAVGVLWALAVLGGIVGLSVQWFSMEWTGILVAMFVLAAAIFAIYLGQVHVYGESGKSLVRSGQITPFVVDILYKRRIVEVLLDVCLVAVAYYSAYRLRFEGAEFGVFFSSFLESLPLVLAGQIAILFTVGTYRGVVWRYFGLFDAITLAKGVLFGTLSTVVCIVYLYRFENYSRTIFIIYAAVLLLLLVGSRASFRLFDEFVKQRQSKSERLLIYGAGDGGAAAVRELLNRPNTNYKMLGFVDDDQRKLKTQIDGHQVIGDYQSLVSLVLVSAVDEIVVSTRTIDPTRIAALATLCTDHGVRLSQLHYDIRHLGAVS